MQQSKKRRSLSNQRKSAKKMAASSTAAKIGMAKTSAQISGERSWRHRKRSEKWRSITAKINENSVMANSGIEGRRKSMAMKMWRRSAYNQSENMKKIKRKQSRRRKHHQ